MWSVYLKISFMCWAQTLSDYFPTHISVIPKFSLSTLRYCSCFFLFFEQRLLKTKTVQWKIYKSKHKPDRSYKCALKKTELLSFAPCKDLAFCILARHQKFLSCESPTTCKRNVSETCAFFQIFVSHFYSDIASNKISGLGSNTYLI